MHAVNFQLKGFHFCYSSQGIKKHAVKLSFHSLSAMWEVNTTCYSSPVSSVIYEDFSSSSVWDETFYLHKASISFTDCTYLRFLFESIPIVKLENLSVTGTQNNHPTSPHACYCNIACLQKRQQRSLEDPWDPGRRRKWEENQSQRKSKHKAWAD